MHRHFDQAVINTLEDELLETTLKQIEAAGGRKVHGPNEIACGNSRLLRRS